MATTESSHRHKAMVAGLLMWENLAGCDRLAIVETVEGARTGPGLSTAHGRVRGAVLRWVECFEDPRVRQESQLPHHLVMFLRGFMGYTLSGQCMGATDSVSRGYWWSGKHVAKDWHRK